METDRTDRINLKKKNKNQIFKKVKIKSIILGNNNNYSILKFIYYILISFVIVIIFSIFSFKLFIQKFIKQDRTTNDIDCLLVKSKLKNKTHPFDFTNELIFFTELIECKIPFSFIRFADGENAILRGNTILASLDRWNWYPNNTKFRESLIKSSSICLNENCFIGLPCKNWIDISKSILSFSNCTSTKYMTFTTLFVNKNYEYFKNWIIRFIKSSNRWKIILVANNIINKNITWAYKFFPIPDHIVENFENISISLLPELANLSKQNNLIFFVSAGPAANIIVAYLSEINKNNIYIDVGSSIEFLTKGYSTRLYEKNGETSKLSCEPFIIENKTLFYMR